jgi:hypothetical protein
MKDRRTAAIVYGIAAAAAAVFFYWVATTPRLYAPGAMVIHFAYEPYFEAIRDDFPANMRHDVNAVFFVRKLYSLVAFSIVGILVAPVIPPRRRIAIDALGVALFSTIIELGQKLIDESPEGLNSNLFDIACGAAGGVIGALVWNLVRTLMRRITKG